ncbi:MAG: hypothetical protein CL840_20425 [Crocinitomicaceae bacterium]|nr:hypothetical protein [Crocinitomicaceae bacterium]|tara:strand:- start:16194 stop:16775 length:582 start_codon:yes stop_codon:yes gene_type:complete
MKFRALDLLDEMISQTRGFIETADGYKQMSEKELNYRELADSWSVLECLEHLNLYGDFYLGELEKRIVGSKHEAVEYFKSTWFGNRTALSMLPKEGKKLNTMNTFKDKNPVHSNLSVTTIDRFIKQQKMMIQLLEKAKGVNLTKIRTDITLPILKFRLGDTLRFVINHNMRHMAQAEKVRGLALQVDKRILDV